MNAENEKNEIPVYILKKLNANSDYSLTIDNGFKFIFKRNYLTNTVWHVTQEYHKHNFWEICLVIRGNSLQRFPDRRPIEMSRGSVFILRPDDVHCISPIQTNAPEDLETSNYLHRDIYILPEKMERLCNALQDNLYTDLLNGETPLFVNLSKTETHRLESLLNTYAGRNDDFDYMHSVIVTHILCAALEHQFYEKAEYPEWLNHLLANLNRENYMTMSIPEIIKTVGYNQSYICRQFKKYTQKTLTDYIHFCKCRYSTTLLSNIDIPISKIAHRLVFADQSAYTRIFKSFYNITPNKWRMQLSQNVSEDSDN